MLSVVSLRDESPLPVYVPPPARMPASEADDDAPSLFDAPNLFGGEDAFRQAAQAAPDGSYTASVRVSSTESPAQAAVSHIAANAASKRGFGQGFDGGANALSVRSPKPKARPRTASQFAIFTGQEFDLLLRSCADGRWRHVWRTCLQSGTRTHRIPGASHFVQLRLTSGEQAGRTPADRLEAVTDAMDSDGIFAILYLCRLLLSGMETTWETALLTGAPDDAQPGLFDAPSDAPTDSLVEWVDLDDVAAKIGMRVSRMTCEERQTVRARIFRYLEFGARAHIVGARPSVYFHNKTGQPVSTRIDAPLWSLPGVPLPLPEGAPIPRRVEVVMTREWARLLQGVAGRQFLPGGEILAALAPGRASGAWARAIGLSLANLWRRRPCDAIHGTLSITRGEVLTRYVASVAPYDRLLTGQNPHRALEYWADALTLLAESGFLADKDEVTAAAQAFRDAVPPSCERTRQGWVRGWLADTVVLRPGAGLARVLASLPPPPARHRKPNISERKRPKAGLGAGGA